MSVTFADGREVHDAPNKARHVCERPRDGERAVARERPVSSSTAYVEPTGDPRIKLTDFFNILITRGTELQLRF